VREAYCQFPAKKNTVPCDHLLGLDIQMCVAESVVVGDRHLQ